MPLLKRTRLVEVVRFDSNSEAKEKYRLRTSSSKSKQLVKSLPPRRTVVDPFAIVNRDGRWEEENNDEVLEAHLFGSVVQARCDDWKDIARAVTPPLSDPRSSIWKGRENAKFAVVITSLEKVPDLARKVAETQAGIQDVEIFDVNAGTKRRKRRRQYKDQARTQATAIAFASNDTSNLSYNRSKHSTHSNPSLLQTHNQKQKSISSSFKKSSEQMASPKKPTATRTAPKVEQKKTSIKKPTTPRDISSTPTLNLAVILKDKISSKPTRSSEDIQSAQYTCPSSVATTVWPLINKAERKLPRRAAKIKAIAALKYVDDDDSAVEIEQDETSDVKFTESEGESPASENSALPSEELDDDSEESSEIWDRPYAAKSTLKRRRGIATTKQYTPTPTLNKSTIPDKGSDEGGDPTDAVGDISNDNLISMERAPGLIVKPQYVDNYKYRIGIDLKVPPMSKNSDIFADMVQNARAIGLDEVIKHLNGRKLNVATMCSGTESPILALQLFQECLSEHGMPFGINHLFSAEIVPFKQAYIERNFQPPIIFRDIRELSIGGAVEATTAYGGKAKIPSGIDMLIAGFSCVDFSGLNNRKKGLGDGGESDDTLRAILDYAEKFRPKIMILENVSGAPWKMLTETIMPGIGYAAHFLRVDTKDYYIPHTRVRGYMICIDTQIFHSPLGVIKKWENKMKNLRRPASSSIEAFLLEEDDPRIVHARAELSNTGRGEGRRTSEVDWARCHGRHQDYRAALNLGQKRPVMNWEDGGSCKAPDNMWRDWTVSQVERIWDTIDISWLRNLLRGFDHQYKIRVLELSQNVDRVTDNAPTGFTGCLTPTGIPFSTLRGGPIIGLEALALQGLPIDKLQLTRESQSKLQDLAGNAMSSTVVGAAILSALISAYRGLPSGGNCMEADVQPILSPLHRQHDLAPFVADTSIYVPVSAAEILHMASLTVRLCLCEGRATVSKTAIQQCIDCNHTTCIKCGVDPSHDYKRMDPATIVQRKSPALFEKLIKEALPMKLTLVGIGEKDIFNLRPNTGKISKDRAWGIYSELIRKAFLSELRFNSVKRSQIWTVYYESDSARMELNIGHNRIEWRLFAKPTAIMAGEDPLRTLLAHPIARMRPEDSDLIKGSWQLWASETIALKATIEDVPEFIPSFENISGLGDFADTWVSQGCKITVSNKDTRIFDEDIRGEYKLLQNCAGPSGSLHVKMNPETFAPFYFFLDPDRIGNPEDDFFVFTNDRRRLTHDETRPRVARIESSWRQTKYNCKEDLTDPRKNEFKVSGSKDSFSLAPQHVANVTCYVDGSWLDISTAAFIPSGGETVSSMRHAPANFDIASFPNSCQSAHVVLSCQTTLPVGESSSWKKNTWLEVGQLHQKEFFSSFAWLMEKTHVLQGLDDWRQASDIFDLSCAKCAPSLPKMNWKLDDKAKLVPFEDPREAAAFEYALKSRPSPLVTQVFISDLGTMNLKISFNPETLIHRAVSNLQNPHQNVKVSWRLITDYTAPPKIHLPEFTIKNNDLDPPTTQPTGFKFSLRREQLRSLGWMLRQEADDIEPFVEEEVEEAEIAQIGWRGEGRATKPVLVRGGVLADQVGYGKTITSLALIDRQKEPDFQASKEEINGRVNLKATLVLIPQHLAKQWHDEIDKFFKIKPKIIEIGNTVSSLKKYTIKQFQDADIIIAPWSIFEGDEYLFLIAQFAGVVELPDKSSSRAQSAWYHNTLSDISEHVEKLKNGGRDLRTAVDAKYASQKSQAESVECIIPSKRLRGQAYLNEKLKLAGTKRKNKEISTGNKGSYTHLPTARGDPFGLQAIENGNAPWNSLKSPLLEMFQFSRIIVDEYTYISGKDSIIIPKLRAKARWILSGTPPIQDFADVKSISTFLGINLGINDFAAGVIKGINIKNLTKDLTTTEEFRSFKDSHSFAWHENRHRVAQRFLEKFMRQNIADIDAIAGAEHLVPITLPAAERAIYLELVQLLAATNFTIKKGKANRDNDRAVRIRELLAGSGSAGEALMKCASHFTLNDLGETLENAPQACDVIVNLRELQYRSLVSVYKRKLKQAVWLLMTSTMDCVQYNNWKARVRINWFGDLDTMKDIWIMIQHAQRSFKDWHGDLFYVHTDEEKKVDGFKLHKIFPEPGQNHNTELRNVTNQLSKLSTELVARRRGLRFFKVVRHIQQISANIRLEASDDECVCSKCGNTDVPTSSASVLSLCGHVLCKDCVSNHGKDTECPTLGCNAVNKDYQIVQAAELGVEDITTLTGEHYGKKIENIIDLIKKVPKDDQVIVFVQFSDLMDKIEAAIEKENISIVALGKKVEKGQKLRSDATLLDDYKKDVSASKKKVLLLNIGNASAAGSNLTNANHIIFVSPYLTERQYTFDAAMIQAIGRARRYGQSKVVHIYHFLSLKTIDVDTLQARKPGKLLAANAAPPPAFVPYRGFKPSGFFLVDNNGNNTNEFGSPVVAQDFAGGED